MANDNEMPAWAEKMMDRLDKIEEAATASRKEEDGLSFEEQQQAKEAERWSNAVQQHIQGRKEGYQGDIAGKSI